MGERIAVVGAGALGGHVGGYFAHAGGDVTMIDAWPEHIEAIRRDGLRLEGRTEAERFTVRPAQALHITDLQSLAHGPGFDIVLMAVKSYDTTWATHMIKDLIAPGGYVVSLQNAINEERIAEVVGWGRVVGCIASKIVVELVGPGHIQRRVNRGGNQHTTFRAGECHGAITPRIERLVELLSVSDSAKATTNLWGERWGKLSVNCMRNPFAAATGQGGNANDRDTVIRKLSVKVCGEALKVAKAHGIAPEKAYGIPAEDAIAACDGDAAAMARCEDIILAAIGDRSETARPSMGQDIAKGRRTEIDYLNGFIVEKASEVGLDAPLNRAMRDVVRNVEAKAVTPAPEHLHDIARANGIG